MGGFGLGVRENPGEAAGAARSSDGVVRLGGIDRDDGVGGAGLGHRQDLQARVRQLLQRLKSWAQGAWYATTAVLAVAIELLPFESFYYSALCR